MKTMIMDTKIPVLLILILFFNPLYSQRSEKIIDNNPVYSFEGTGYIESGLKKKMIFSKFSTEGMGTNEVSLNNNEITVNKDGIYRINISSAINKAVKKEQQLIYSVNLNGKEAFLTQQRAVSSDGTYYFQIKLKSGDIMSFDIISDIISDELSTNNLLVQFTDPKLIKLPEDHH